MSERPTDTRPSRAATAHGHGHDARLHAAGGAAGHAGAGRQSLAERAANFRKGAPFLVERATLYDPEPLDPPTPSGGGDARSPRRFLPAALTLLGVVVIVGLAAGVLFVRNADVVRHEAQDVGAGRLQQFSERAVPSASPGQQPNARTIAYDLSRRPKDSIVGAWRPRTEDVVRQVEAEPPPAARRRRPLPRRMGMAPSVPPEPVTRPVAAAPPRYDAPEPKRRIADGDHPLSGERAASPIATGSSPHMPPHDPELAAPSVVARVGRAAEPLEASGPADETPLAEIALPMRRPDPTTVEEEARAQSARARRARLLRLRRQVRRKQWDARRRALDERQWISEALYGNRFLGVERLLP